MAVTDIPPDLELNPLTGDPYTAEEWLSMFHLLLIALDPYTVESTALLDTAGRILDNYRGANARVAFLCTASPDEVRSYLGPWADRLLAFSDPDRVAVSALGLERLPAIIHIRPDGALEGVAEGWDPEEWRNVLEFLSSLLLWSEPGVPEPTDPPAFAGTPAAG